MIYKVLTSSQFHEFKASGVFHGSPVDLSDGYLHFSTEAQLKGTLEKHYAGQTDLYVLAVDPLNVEANLRWEVSRGGEKFPHLYALLPWDLIQEIQPLDQV